MSRKDEQPTPTQILTVIESVKHTVEGLAEGLYATNERLDGVAEQVAGNSEALTKVLATQGAHSAMLDKIGTNLDGLVEKVADHEQRLETLEQAALRPFSSLWRLWRTESLNRG